MSVGLLGAVGAGVIALMLGSLAWRAGNERFPRLRKNLLVLIPAHNEEKVLQATLHRVRLAGECAGVAVEIFVGADACTDRTVAIARDCGASIIECSHRSKWATIRELAAKAEPGQWAAFVDAGAIWPENFLIELEDLFEEENLLGIAPAYYPKDASFLEKMLWQIEMRWKKWENYAGGPISAHGATIFFRGEVVKAAFEYLQKFPYSAWLNDDIALPFSARILFPHARFLYWCPGNKTSCVSDAGLDESASTGRRRRMVVGNFQWMISLWPRSFLLSPAAGFLAIRRFARVFWAYWGVCIGYAFFYFVNPVRSEAIVLTAFIGIVFSATLWLLGKRGLVKAAFASLASPLYFPLAWRGRAQPWS